MGGFYEPIQKNEEEGGHVMWENLLFSFFFVWLEGIKEKEK